MGGSAGGMDYGRCSKFKHLKYFLGIKKGGYFCRFINNKILGHSLTLSRIGKILMEFWKMAHQKKKETLFELNFIYISAPLLNNL
jgi:hypothetical protein